MSDRRIYIAIDLKSFYASVECVARGLDPMDTNLVVADQSRTEKTICLAVSPSLKAYGISGRARLFEVVQRVKEINNQRTRFAPHRQLEGSSTSAKELAQHPEMALDYIAAPPQMAHYMKVSTQIYQIYLKYVAPEDIHVYSIDEVFIDATRYLSTYHQSPREFATNHDSGRFVLHRHHRHRRHRHELISCQNRHGHRGQAHCPGSVWRSNCPVG